MKTIYRLLSILIVPSVLVLYSYSSGSPGGKTGSSGDNGITCTQCHSGTAIAEANWITSNIPADGYTAGETYTITVTGTHNGVVKMGFELTAENSFGSKKGTWTITDAARTQLANSNTAVTHTSGGTAPNGNTNTWNMDWTAPEAGTGNVKFNTAVNAADGNGNTSGDQIYTSVLTVTEAVVLNPEITEVNPDNADQGWSGDVVISGSETSWLDGVGSVIFKYGSDNSITLVPDVFVVNSNTVITATFNIPADQQFGSYDVFVDELEDTDGFMVNEMTLSPVIVSVVPDHGQQESSVTLEIKGDETSWAEGVSDIMIKLHDDSLIMLAAGNIMVMNDTLVHAVLNIPVDQQIGVYDLYVDDLMLENGFTVDIINDISDYMDGQISIYPVPASVSINIELPSQAKYRIVSLDGRIINKFVNASEYQSVDISGLKNGIYIVQIELEGNIVNRKIIKR